MQTKKSYLVAFFSISIFIFFGSIAFFIQDKREFKEKNNYIDFSTNTLEKTNKIQVTENQTLSDQIIQIYSKEKNYEHVIILKTIGGFGNTLNGFNSWMAFCLINKCVVKIDFTLGRFSIKNQFFNYFKIKDKRMQNLFSANRPFILPNGKSLDHQNYQIIEKNEIDGLYSTGIQSKMAKYFHSKKRMFMHLAEVLNLSTKEKRSKLLIHTKFNGNYLRFLSKEKIEFFCNQYNLCPTTITQKKGEMKQTNPKLDINQYYQDELEIRPNTNGIGVLVQTGFRKRAIFGEKIGGDIFNTIFEIKPEFEDPITKIFKDDGRNYIISTHIRTFTGEDSNNEVFKTPDYSDWAQCIDKQIKKQIRNKKIDENKQQIGVYVATDKLMIDSIYEQFSKYTKEYQNVKLYTQNDIFKRVFGFTEAEIQKIHQEKGKSDLYYQQGFDIFEKLFVYEMAVWINSDLFIGTSSSTLSVIFATLVDDFSVNFVPSQLTHKDYNEINCLTQSDFFSKFKPQKKKIEEKCT